MIRVQDHMWLQTISPGHDFHIIVYLDPGHTTSVPQVQIEVVYEKVG